MHHAPESDQAQFKRRSKPFSALGLSIPHRSCIASRQGCQSVAVWLTAARSLLHEKKSCLRRPLEILSTSTSGIETFSGEVTASQTQQIDTLLRIQTLLPQLTEKERDVALYILEHDEVIYQTITQVVKSCGASYGSVDRFCKKLGCSGFQDLKIALARDQSSRAASRAEDGEGDPLQRAARAARRDIDCTLKLLDRAAVEKAARVLVKAEFVMVAGVSSSAGTALGIDYRLTRYGIASACLIDNHMQRHRAATLTSRDAAFLLSYSGSTREILATAEIAASSGATVIGLTNYAESPLAEAADICLVTGIRTDPLTAEIASKVATEFVVTALFESVARLKRNAMDVLTTTFEATADRQL